MSLDFQQVNQQVHNLGEKAASRQEQVKAAYERARQLMARFARDFAALQARVTLITRHYDAGLRCALPTRPEIRAPEALDRSFPLPPAPVQATIIAADGSQIPYDRHEAVEYCLVNVGAIQMALNSAAAPRTMVHSHLIYDEELFPDNNPLSEASLALLRDNLERTLLADLAETANSPVMTFTDGPMELWGAKDSQTEGVGFQKQLKEYQKALRRLCKSGAGAAGYVDKPASDLVVRLLEVMDIPEAELKDVKNRHPLRGVRDFDLYRLLLEPGERSAVFKLQSQSAGQYQDELELHFFYLNVGRPGHAWVSRVEIPAWVAADAQKLDLLHAVLIQQCRVTAQRPFPYMLHRAHETAVVSLEEREQVTQMIVQELRRRGVEPGEKSYKQFLKDVQGRTGYKP